MPIKDDMRALDKVVCEHQNRLDVDSKRIDRTHRSQVRLAQCVHSSSAAFDLVSSRFIDCIPSQDG
jgi:hypothetical protein